MCELDSVAHLHGVFSLSPHVRLVIFVMSESNLCAIYKKKKRM